MPGPVACAVLPVHVCAGASRGKILQPNIYYNRTGSMTEHEDRPCFATMSAADLALRGLLAPTRPCCPDRVCACSSDPTWVASLYAYSLHRAVATVNMDAAAVNIMMALVLPSRRPGFGSGHQTQRQRRHATVAMLAVTVPLQNAPPRPISTVRTHPPRALPPSQPHRAPPFGAGKR